MMAGLCPEKMLKGRDWCDISGEGGLIPKVCARKQENCKITGQCERNSALFVIVTTVIFARTSIVVHRG